MALKRIGDVLLKEHVITEEELKKALKEQKTDERLGETLVRMKIVSEMQILKALEASTGVQRISLINFTIDSLVLGLIDENFCRRNNIIPLRIEGNRLMFATSDP
ncbi:MAG: type II secretion system protein GspE, partial [Tenericutes bacterium HGW-Tenericutes-3]